MKFLGWTNNERKPLSYLYESYWSEEPINVNELHGTHTDVRLVVSICADLETSLTVEERLRKIRGCFLLGLDLEMRSTLT